MTPKRQASKTIDEILTKAFNDFYDYIIEKDIVKVAHEYSEKTVYKEAHQAITQAMLDMVGEDEKPDMRLGQNAYIYSGAVQYRNELRATQRKALKKNMGLK